MAETPDSHLKEDLDEQQRIALREELNLIASAEQALQNRAIVEYFDEVEQQAIDALLDPDLATDERAEWRLKCMAQIVRQLKQSLHDRSDMRAHVEAELKALE